MVHYEYTLYGGWSGLPKAERILLSELGPAAFASATAIGELSAKSTFMDVNLGDNPRLRGYVERTSEYRAIDLSAYCTLKNADIGPFPDPSVDIAHVGYTLGHITDDHTRHEVIRRTHHMSTHRTIFVDYDWTRGAQGNTSMQKLAALMLSEEEAFDAGYGADSFADIKSALEGEEVSLVGERIKLPRMYNAPLLRELAQIAVDGFTRTNNLERLQEAQTILDNIRPERTRDDASGYFLPDIITIQAIKSTEH